MKYPKPDIHQDNSPKIPTSPFRFVTYFMGQFKFGIGLMILLEVAQKTTEILIPYSFKKMIDTVHGSEGAASGLFDDLKSPLFLFFALSFGTVVFSRACGALLVITAPRLRKLVRATVYQYLQFHSHRYFISHFAGSLANRINEISMGVNHGLWTILFDFLPVIVSFSVSLYLLSLAHLQLGITLGAWVLVYVLVSFLLAKRCQNYAKDFAASRSKTTGHIVDAVTNIMNTKIFANLKFERLRLDDQLESEVNYASKTFWFMEKMRWFQFTSAFLLQIGIITLSLYYLNRGEISVGDFAMVSTLGLLVINEAKGLSRRFLEFFEYIGNINDGVRIIIKPFDLNDRAGSREIDVKRGEIEFKDVSFAYNKNADVFNNLSLKIPSGQKVGLVGFSGSGKTTFANLIMRFFDVNSGQILVDGQNIADIKQDSLRENISMIPQDPMLFHRSLYENIRYGKLDATDDEVVEAAKKADADGFVQRLGEKYDSLVGERGVKLSGGQRQRIAIARAILKSAPILILDEATSSLDSVTERAIQNTLEKEMVGKTVIVIAHRLSTLAQLDRIIVFDKGKIIEEGTHAELLSKMGHYARLWNLQAGGFLPEHDVHEAEVSPDVIPVH
ncbi:MAG: ABC transporter ATP-binding protein [Bdellovibrionales bacterium]|nr:ABC transporter ATP-binding protein [Bdellovibrionales bacterium]